MEYNQDIVDLIYKYIREDISPEEMGQLQQWVNESPANSRFFKEVTQPGQLFTDSVQREEIDEKIDLEVAWQKLLARGLPTTTITTQPPVRKSRLFRFRLNIYAVAASVALLIMAGVYLYNKPAQKPAVVQASTTAPKNDIAPNSSEPMLTLADGRVVPLNNSTNGDLAIQGNVKITRNKNGEIVYTGKSDAAMQYNTVTVPKGGNIVSLVLGDGTRVWLNAASSIRYPTAFIGSERKVELTGEAYFEVTPIQSSSSHARTPFIVAKGKTIVTVLGTHFNVNAYDNDDAIKVTLLEGKVAVKEDAQSALLKPGEQAIVDQVNSKAIAIDRSPDIEATMAWKNGLFVFDNSSTEAIMKQVERWYNVEVIYQGNVKRWTFNGQISRYSNVSKVLELMEATGTVHFKIEDRKIYVTP